MGMTEHSRGPLGSSQDDDDLGQEAGRGVAGAEGAPSATDGPQQDDLEPGREGQADEAGAVSAAGEPGAPDDRDDAGPLGDQDDVAEPGAPTPPVAFGKERPGISDRLVAGFAPPDSYGNDDDMPGPPPATAVDQPVVDQPGPEDSVPGGYGSGEPTAQDVVADGVVPDGPVAAGAMQQPGHMRPAMSQGPVPPGAAPPGQVPPGGDPGQGRPGFVPHGYEQDQRMAAHRQQAGDPRAAGQGTPYGWPPQRSHQPPPGNQLAGPPPGAGPMGPPPGGPRPMGMPGGPGQPPGGPNWAPVPPLPSASRGGPGLGLLAVVALIIALLAGGLGAGIGVLATGDSNQSGGISLGGDDTAGGQNKNRPPDSVAGIARKVLPSVVMIRVSAPGGEGGAGGTGFIVNGGYIITNNHVVSSGGGGGEIQVVFNDKKTLPATVKGRDPSSDIAVLKPSGQHDLPALQMGNSDEIAVGDPVIAIGSPLGLQGSVTTGIVSSTNRAVPTGGEGGGGDGSVLNAIQTDAAINPGNSGGPLVDSRGRVIGINTAIATLGGQGLGGASQSGSIGLGFAIPVNQGKRVAEEIINTGTARRAQLGIGMDQQYQGPGVKIATAPMGNVQPIVKGGPAEKAGLKAGDVITKLGGQPIEGPADLSAQIRSRGPGDKVKVTYQRDGKETTVDVTLAEAN
jgi:putative serine protease PepD